MYIIVEISEIRETIFRNWRMGRVQVAHACNPSNSGSRHQEDCGSKPAQANSSQPYLEKNPSQKRAGGVAQGVGPEFKPQYSKNKNKTKPNPGVWRIVLPNKVPSGPRVGDLREGVCVKPQL
jgi:hypothetical protein